MRNLLLALCIVLSGCATLEEHARDHPATATAQTVFVACRVADVATTWKIVVLQRGKELNPFLAGFMHSLPQFILIEAVLTGIALYAEDKVPSWAALGITAASCLAPIHNLGHIK